MTTWTSYGKIDDCHTGEIMAGLAKNRMPMGESPPPAVIEWLTKMTKNRQL